MGKEHQLEGERQEAHSRLVAKMDELGIHFESGNYRTHESFNSTPNRCDERRGETHLFPTSRCTDYLYVL